MHPKFVWAFDLIRLPTPPAHRAVSVTTLVTRFIVFGVSDKCALWLYRGHPYPPGVVRYLLLTSPSAPGICDIGLNHSIPSCVFCLMSFVPGSQSSPTSFPNSDFPATLLFAGIHSEHAQQHRVTYGGERRRPHCLLTRAVASCVSP